MNGIISLGCIIMKGIARAKLGENDSAFAEDIIDALSDVGLDELDTRKAKRQLDELSDRIAIACKEILSKMINDKEKEERIVTELNEAISKCSFTFDILLSLDFTPNKLKSFISNEYVGYKVNLDNDEQEIYERMISYISELIIQIFYSLPDFTSNGILGLIRKFDEMDEKIELIIKELNNIIELSNNENRDVATQNFEREYRNIISNKYRYVYMFGAPSVKNKRIKRYELSIAYIEMEIAEEYGDKIELKNIFNNSNIVWIEGEAGSGKTTLLQWIAVNSAINNTDSDCNFLKDTLPIFLSLRSIDCKKINLLDIIESVMKNITYKVPDNWLSKITKNEKILLLIDGLDEISSANRTKVFEWIDEIYQEFSKNTLRIIITTRPKVIDELMIENVKIQILPMKLSKTMEFMKYWHNAVLLENFKESEEKTESIYNDLKEIVINNESVARLTKNPLLAAMICALHYQDGLELPLGRKEIYESCCRMLIDSRDNERDIDVGIRIPNYDEKKVLISDLAYWMVRNNRAEISVVNAIACIEEKLHGLSYGMNYDGKVEDVLEYLVARSGILREPEEGKIDFIHKTFQEYLAAYEINRKNDWGVLCNHSTEQSWYETFSLAISMARKTDAEEVVKFLLEKYKENTLKTNYLFLATNCCSNAIELCKELREEVATLVSTLIPPSENSYKFIAEAGEFVVPLLKYNKEFSNEDSIYCLKALRIIGGKKALIVSTSFLNKSLSNDAFLEFGFLVSRYTPEILQLSDIERILKEYICKCIKQSSLKIDTYLLFLAHLGKEFDNKECEVSKMTLYRYQDYNLNEYSTLFQNLTELTILGNYNSIAILKYCTKLRVLKIYSKSENFDLYSLKKFKNALNINVFYLCLENYIYMNGNDLDFIIMVS